MTFASFAKPNNAFLKAPTMPFKPLNALPKPFSGAVTSSPLPNLLFSAYPMSSQANFKPPYSSQPKRPVFKQMAIHFSSAAALPIEDASLEALSLHTANVTEFVTQSHLPSSTTSEPISLHAIRRARKKMGLMHTQPVYAQPALTNRSAIETLRPSFSSSFGKVLFLQQIANMTQQAYEKTVRTWGLSTKVAACALLVTSTVFTLLFSGAYAQQWLAPGWEAELTAMPLSNGLTVSDMQQRTAQAANPEGEAGSSAETPFSQLTSFSAQPDGLPEDLLQKVREQTSPSPKVVKVVAPGDLTVKAVTEKSAEETAALNQKLKQLNKKTKVSLKTRFGWVSPVSNAYLSSPFGWRHGRLHQGLDYAAPIGSGIMAAKAGRVVYSGWQGGYGKLVVVEHGDGTKTKYAHCNSLYVRVGQWVQQGQRLASVGNTGHSTGPHLHFELHKSGVAINPSHVLRSGRNA